MSTPDELRRIADILETHPGVTTSVSLHGADAAIRALFDIGDVEITDDVGSYITLRVGGTVPVSVISFDRRWMTTAERSVAVPRSVDEIREALDATD